MPLLAFVVAAAAAVVPVVGGPAGVGRPPGGTGPGVGAPEDLPCTAAAAGAAGPEAGGGLRPFLHANKTKQQHENHASSTFQLHSLSCNYREAACNGKR